MAVAAYPAQPIQGALSTAVLLVSVVVLARVLSQGQALQGAALYVLSAGVIFLTLFWPQHREFEEVKQAVGGGRAYVKRRDGRGVRGVLPVVVLLASIIVGPFLLSAVLSSAAWFGLVLGLIAGFSLSQLGFILHVRNWERANSVRLESYIVTADVGRKVVVERGVRARR